MDQMTSVPIQQAMAQLRALSADAATRQIAWNRERALISEITERRAEREEGRLEGELIGERKGKLEGKLETLTRLLIKRFGPLSPDTAQRLQIATSEQLEHWTDRILDAPTSAAVFAEH